MVETPLTPPQRGWSSCVDWLTATFPEASRGVVLDRVRGLVGSDPTRRAGMHGYSDGHRFEGGAHVLFGGNAGTCSMNVPGSFLELKPWPEVLELMGWVRQAGGKPTRIDLALDVWFDPPRPLLAQLDAAIEAGHLLRPVMTRNALQRNGAIRWGGGIYLGSSSSPAHVLVYDKGVETRTLFPDHRFRVELRGGGDHALPLFDAVLDAPDPSLEAARLPLAFARFESPDGEPVQPWADLIALVGSSPYVRLAPRSADLESFREHARRSVLAKVASMAHEAGCTIPDVLAWLTDDLDPAPPRRVDPVVRQWCELWGCRRADRVTLQNLTEPEAEWAEPTRNGVS